MVDCFYKTFQLQKVFFSCETDKTNHVFHHVSVFDTELDETVWQTASIVRQELSKEEWYWGPASK